MPSIRLKGSAYSSLRDSSPNPTPRSRHLTTLFIDNAEAAHASTENTTSPRIHRSMPTLRLDVPQPEHSPETFQRPRSGTTNSRISTYISGGSARYPRSINSDGGGEAGLQTSPLISPRNTILTHEGSIAVRSTGESGVVASAISLFESDDGSSSSSFHDIHHDDLVDHLDVIDPQIGTVSSLTNAANALLIPPNVWYSRRPVVEINQPPTSNIDAAELRGRREKALQDSIDRHVDDVLRRPSKFRRTMMGIWSFLKTPMGIITAIYGFCVVFWGAAIVFFLAKFINFHNADKQGFWVEVSSQVVNGLFTATGVGLIPFRVLDTYRILWIWHFKRKTRRLRVKAGLPALFDEDDLPDPKYDANYVHVLTEKEEKFLYKQQRKFRYSQTWYRPHGTETHRAFPINLALAICLLNDANSVFQIMLCGTMWGLDRFQRPAWSTGILIPCGFIVGIAAAVLIWRGGEKTKRVAQVEERLRAALMDDDDVDPSLPASYPPPRQRNAIKMTKLPEGLEEEDVKVDEEMTVPSTSLDTRTPSSR